MTNASFGGDLLGEIKKSHGRDRHQVESTGIERFKKGGSDDIRRTMMLSSTLDIVNYTQSLQPWSHRSHNSVKTEYRNSNGNK